MKKKDTSLSSQPAPLNPKHEKDCGHPKRTDQLQKAAHLQ